MLLFCPNCSTYFPSGLACPRCGHERPGSEVPTPPGQAVWAADVPGSVAGRMALAEVDGQGCLVVPWGYVPRRAEGRQSDGGISLLSVADGSCVWTRQLGVPVEGGAAVAGDVVVVGLASRGIGSGEGWLVALDLRSGAEIWRVKVGGAVRSAPTVDEVRVYATAGDGALYCFDLRDGQPIGRGRYPLVQRATPIPASPIIAGGASQVVVVGTYGAPHDLEDGKVIVLDGQGRKLWEEGAGGNVRGTPALGEGVVYVTSFRHHPSAGVISAFDVRTHRSLWAQPFAIQARAGDHGAYNFSASPLVHRGMLYAGSLDHRLYALDAATATLKWCFEAGGGIATGPAWLEGLVVFGANDGKVYAVDAATGRRAWDFAVGGHVLTDPLASRELVFSGSDDGKVIALAWHLGQYEWAADRAEKMSRFSCAGDFRALSAHFGVQRDLHRVAYQSAAVDWTRAGESEKSAHLWLALDRLPEAADAFREAGQFWKMRAPRRAAGYFKKAADLYFFPLRRSHELDECTRALASCASLPYIRLQAVNLSTFVQWQPGKFTLRLANEGFARYEGRVRLWSGGALEPTRGAEVDLRLECGQVSNIPLSATPARRESTLELEIEYDPSEFAPLRGMLAIPIEAVEPQKRPLQIGDAAVVNITFAQATEEGQSIITRDVGAIRSRGGIVSVQTAGDVGAISADEIHEVQVDGDVGVVKG